MLDRVTGMQVFARVASLGSLSAAARVMGMSQTMATKHIAALEDRLGAKLLHRTTRRVSLTEAGRRYLDGVERILSDLDETETAVTAQTMEVRGTLRLNVPVSFGNREIAPILPELLTLHPALKVDLGLNDRYVDLIDEGWDLAIRIGSLESSSLIARRVAPCRIAVCASPSYLARHGHPRRIADLQRHNCLDYTLSRAASGGVWAFGADGKTRIATTGTLKANNGEALVAAAVAGLGIVYVPTFLVAREIADGVLVTLELDVAPSELGGVFTVYPAGRRPPAKVRACIDWLAARFAPVPPWDRLQRA